MRAVIRVAMLVQAACGFAEPSTPPRPPPLDADDRDRDGYRGAAAGGTDCADADPHASPAVPETCNGRDDDCDGEVDEGFDCVAGIDEPCGEGLLRRCSPHCMLGDCEPLEDCAGGAPECVPGAVEPCDEGCAGGVRACTPGCSWAPCQPPHELCNGLDDDCDGEADEGLWGLASGLHELGTSMSGTHLALAVAEDGLALAFMSALGRIEIVWADGDGVQLGEPTILFSEGSQLLPHAIAAGRDAVFTARLDPGLLAVCVSSPEGPRSQWTTDFYSLPIPVWTGVELLIVDGNLLRALDLDGAELREPVPIPYGDHGGAVWTSEGLVVAVNGGLSWIDEDGSEWRRVDVEGDHTPSLAVGESGLLAVDSVEAEWVATAIGQEGAVEWTSWTAAPEQLALQGVLAVDGGWVALGLGGNVGGWWLHESGAAMTKAARWFSRPDGAMTMAGDGSVAWLGTTERSVARFGCRSEMEEGR